MAVGVFACPAPAFQEEVRGLTAAVGGGEAASWASFCGDAAQESPNSLKGQRQHTVRLTDRLTDHSRSKDSLGKMPQSLEGEDPPLLECRSTFAGAQNTLLGCWQDAGFTHTTHTNHFKARALGSLEESECSPGDSFACN